MQVTPLSLSMGLMEKQPSLLLYLACMLLLQSCWFSFVVSASSLPRMNRLNNFTDQAALLTFKSHITRDPNNSLSNSWNTNTSFCNWIGVSCSHHRQRVTKLNLSHMGLEGVIPPHIANLSFLVELDLRNNSFHGHLPFAIGNLRRLKAIDLRRNKLEGTIPHSLANLSELHFLGLGGNNLRGNIPADLGRLFNLQYLILQNNTISGEIPLPIFNISSLVVVSFEGNSLSGQLPADTGRFLPNLEGLYLVGNQMSGSIPIFLSNASKLMILSLAHNNFSGSIPGTLGHLLHLKVLELNGNNLIGTTPSNIFNLSYLTELEIGFNQLSGNLPHDIGNWLPNIQILIVNVNRFSGKVPLSLGNASKLSTLALAGNHFSGSVPTTLGKLSFLRILTLHHNQLVNNHGAKELKFLTYLTNCRLLEVLALGSNPLHGILPSAIGNFSILLDFNVAQSQIEGTIPRELGNLSSLITLVLGDNNFHGTIPSTIGKLEKLQRLNIDRNILKGSIPIELSHLWNIGELNLGENQLSGGIPDIFYNISRLELLSLAINKLTRIPSSLWTLQDLLILDLSHNSFRGVLPQEIGNLKNAVIVNLSENQFDGGIPDSMGHLEMLQYLDLSLNSLAGPIPQSFGELISIEVMNLSSNHLNGTIPKSLENLRYLKVLNLSFNSLEGEIPNGTVFKNFTAQSFIGNHKLCSGPTLHTKLNVSICPTHETKSKAGSPLIKIILATTIVTALVVCFSLFIIYHGKKKKNIGPTENSPTRAAHRMISYQELLHATSNFSEANLIGVGSFGSVYKGTMIDGSFVAVKILNIQSHRAWESFDAECKVMRNVRHRNLVKIITSCSNLDFRALILQFMPNGSLDQWLHSDDNHYLTLLQRIGIMIDVASAMEYLHHHYSGPVVHCDLKPSNVLLDEDMVAHVSDFGIAKLIEENKSTTRTNTLGTIGYVAPEYGLVGKVSAKGDVYNYGILLLEMLTRKKPTDSMFIGEMSLRQWVNAAFPDAIIDVIDTNLLEEINSRGNNAEEVDDLHGRQLSCLLSIAEVGLLCSTELAWERINMKDVVVRLMKIKKKFLSM